MKAAILCGSLLLLSSLAATAQSSEALQYAPRPIALLSNDQTEGIIPLVFTINGHSHLEFIPASRMMESMTAGGQPLRFGDLLSALREATDTINRLQNENQRLQAENDKLWNIAMKDAPAPQPPSTVVLQQAAPQPADPLSRYILLRSFLPQTYNLNVQVSDCTRLPALCAGR